MSWVGLTSSIGRLKTYTVGDSSVMATVPFWSRLGYRATPLPSHDRREWFFLCCGLPSHDRREWILFAACVTSEPASQDFRHAPSLRHAAPRRIRRFGVE